MIYFVQRKSGGRIKIGQSYRLSARIVALSVEYSADLVVLGVMGGGFDIEHLVHDRFSHLREEGEWFRDEADLLEFIRANAREWDGVDDGPKLVVTKISEDILNKVRVVVAHHGKRNGKRWTIAEYLDERLGPLVEHDYRQTFNSK